jgi:hypothetical protein
VVGQMQQIPRVRRLRAPEADDLVNHLPYSFSRDWFTPFALR